MVNGNNKDLQSANPYGVSLIINHANNWPLQGLMFNDCYMNIQFSNGKVYVSLQGYSVELLENYLNNLDKEKQNQQVTRGKEMKICTTITRRYRNSLGILISNNNVTSNWPAYSTFISERQKDPFSSEVYDLIIKTVDALEKEYLSLWPYPNKERKLIEIKALAELVSELYNSPYKPAKEIVNEIKQKYPQAILGSISQRVNSIFDLLDPSEQKMSAYKI